MMARFAEEIRQMDIDVDRKRRDQQALDQQNGTLRAQLEEMKFLESKHEQLKVSLEQETQRRVQAEAEQERLRAQLQDVQA